MWKIFLLVALASCSKPEDDSRIADCCYYVPYLADCFDYESKIVQIETTKRSNSATPLYILVKTTHFASFLLDSYQNIAMEVGSAEEDPSCLACLCLLPGETKILKLKLPKEEPIAFYGIFTNPRSNWKTMIQPQKDFRRINVLIGEQEILSITAE